MKSFKTSVKRAGRTGQGENFALRQETTVKEITEQKFTKC